MFHGTQHVPKQIIETFILSKKLSVTAMECINDEASPAVLNLFEKLKNSNHRRNDSPLSKGLCSWRIKGSGAYSITNFSCGEVASSTYEKTAWSYVFQICYQ